MKKIILFGITSLCLYSSVCSKDVVLDSLFVGILDKIMTGGAYGTALKVRRDMRKNLFGEKDQQGNILGSYEYQGVMYSASQLSKIEHQYEMEYLEKKDELEEFTEELVALEDNYCKKCEELKEVLELAKEDFLIITESYLGALRGAKKALLGLIRESCDKRGVTSCLLLKWGKAEEGTEDALIRNEIVTFKDFEKFCIDLCNCIGDIARSCPKSKGRFLDIIKRSRKR